MEAMLEHSIMSYLSWNLWGYMFFNIILTAMVARG